jgi:hypothetical protein
MPIAPTTAINAPPTNIYTERSVGAPVNILERSELREFIALLPNTINTMPPTSSAKKIALFISFSNLLVHLDVVKPSREKAQRVSGTSPANDPDQKHDDCNNQQDVNEAANGVGGDQAE